MTETQRQTETEREGETEKQTERDRETERDKDRQTETERKEASQKIYTATLCFFTVRCINVPTPNRTLALNPVNQGDYMGIIITTGAHSLQHQMASKHSYPHDKIPQHLSGCLDCYLYLAFLPLSMRNGSHEFRILIPSQNF